MSDTIFKIVFFSFFYPSPMAANRSVNKKSVACEILNPLHDPCDWHEFYLSFEHFIFFIALS